MRPRRDLRRYLETHLGSGIGVADLKRCSDERSALVHAADPASVREIGWDAPASVAHGHDDPAVVALDAELGPLALGMTCHVGERLLRDSVDHQLSLRQEVWQGAVDAQLARIAVNLAVERHVGKRERIVTREGEAWVYYGKDLTETRTLIGTGGVFIYNSHVPYIFSAAAVDNQRYDVLRPKNPSCFVDSSYLLYAVGLLSESRPGAAAEVGKDVFVEIGFP